MIAVHILLWVLLLGIVAGLVYVAAFEVYDWWLSRNENPTPGYLEIGPEARKRLP